MLAVHAALEAALHAALQHDAVPPRLRSAMHAAVFPGGARLRPRLCLAVAAASGAPEHPAAMRAAVAVELLHCASLVHDDLPCFDNAAVRRGSPTLHRQYGEAMAVLVGDGLIMRAFAVAADVAINRAAAGVPLVAELARAATLLVAGQGWECEPVPNLQAYHRGKTAALFEAATVAGALAAGVDAAPWRALGGFVGQAYQLADDLADAACDDPAFNMVRVHGRAEAYRRLQQVLHAARNAAPVHAAALEEWFAGLHHLLRDVGRVESLPKSVSS